MAWTFNDTKIALDIIDWTRLWGDRPVGFEEWRVRLFPTTKEPSAKRTWLRLRHKMRTGRYQTWIEVSINPMSIRGEMELAVLPGAAQAAERCLDKIEADRVDVEAERTRKYLLRRAIAERKRRAQQRKRARRLAVRARRMADRLASRAHKARQTAAAV